MNDIKVIGVLDPRLSDQHAEPLTVIKEITPSNSSILNPDPAQQSNSGLSFSFYSPSEKTYLNPLLTITQEIKVYFEGVPPVGVNLINIDQQIEGLQAFPLSKMTSSAKLTLNSTGITSVNNYDKYVDSLARRIDCMSLYKNLSSTPYYQDISDDLNRATTSNKNPLANYFGSGTYKQGRNCVEVTDISNPVGDGVNTKTGYIKIKITEPLFLPPLVFNNSPKNRYLTNIRQIQVDLVFKNDLFNNVWSYSATAKGFGYTSASVYLDSSNVSRSSLNCQFLSSPEMLPAKNNFFYDSLEIVPYNIDNVANGITAGSSQSFQSSIFTLNSTPRKIMIYLTERDADRSAQNGITYASINSISMNFGNNNGVFASYNTFQLYQLSSKNGLRMSYDEWSGKGDTVGSILIFDVSDLPLKSSEGVGVENWNTFSFTLNFTNNTARTISYALNVIVSYDTILQLSNNNVSTQYLNVISKQKAIESVLTAQQSDNRDSLSLYGGSWWDTMQTTLKKGYNMAKNACEGLDFIDKFIPKNKKKGSALMATGGISARGGKLLSRSKLRELLDDEE